MWTKGRGSKTFTGVYTYNMYEYIIWYYFKIHLRTMAYSANVYYYNICILKIVIVRMEDLLFQIMITFANFVFCSRILYVNSVNYVLINTWYDIMYISFEPKLTCTVVDFFSPLLCHWNISKQQRPLIITRYWYITRLDVFVVRKSRVLKMYDPKWFIIPKRKMGSNKKWWVQLTTCRI